MNRRDFIKILALSSGASMLGARALPGISAALSPGQPRLVMLYAPCTVNKHFLSPYDSSIGYTPHLKRFASGAAVFTDVQAECGMSGTCYASMFSGCYADRHGIFTQPEKLDDSVQLITEAFSAGGYDVYFWGGHPMASYYLNYGKGVKPENTVDRPLLADHPMFESILEKLASDENYKAFVLTNFTVTHASYMAPDPYIYDSLSTRGKVSDKFIEAYGKEFWELNSIPDELKATGLEEDEFHHYNRLYQEQKWVDVAYSFEETVKKLLLSSKGREKFIRTIDYLYKLNISRLDLLFGRVVKRIEESGLLDDSIIAFTADHGETLYRDNTFFKYSHGFQLAPEVLSVPLIIHAPALGIKPAKIDFPVRSIDIFPTLAGLCGVEINAGYKLEGMDISGALAGTEESPSMLSYSHTNPIFDLAEFNLRAAKSDIAFKLFHHNNPNSIWLAVKDGSEVIKLQKSGIDRPLEFMMFDLESDPEERNNLFDESNDRHKQLREELFAYKSRIVKAIKAPKTKKTPDITVEEKLKKLKEMGYVK